MRIGFAFTGAGHLLRESVQVAEKLAKDHEVTIFLSGAAEEVLKMYGLYERVERLTGGKYRELATDSNQKFSYPITGRLSLGKYDLLIVSPATANTVSKIVYGIADTLVTNAVAQSGKGAVPVYMVPVDIHPGPIDTVLPSKIEASKCQSCDDCVASLACEQGAIIPHEEIDLTKCIGCGLCRNTCPYDAISEGKIITIYMRDIDIENTRKLASIDNIQIFEDPNEILDKI
ncbi:MULTISPECIES: dihydromethanopterin reductase (acceptor) [Methanobrevibacter]|uniref:dihydromethanopterin reductase (acceptor) n=1 Tax=Methanobrevibacter TaxID=2172 RepID=UPI0015B7BEFE|nr:MULTISPECIES: dihydromethanopterin reductase (acceptor) [Methanobrevibacter]MBS7258281.1 dihydromethanopterin reductase (acceptor) [Methanobrevibacter sp.]MCI7428993.1 dihydromethanopterin reductase (acceptor) [Methanobrevibacter sp.]MDY3096234.1 dihydromethanopterin reductase (acceptor) [Methanobrevibacter sp.]